jgi:hypothetical protein
MVALDLNYPFVATELTVWIFFTFWLSKTRVSSTSVISSLSPTWCCLSSSRRHHTAAPCHASFPWSQDELAASGSCSGNTLSSCLPSRAKTKPLNLHHCHRSPSLDRPTPTLYCYKNIISTLATLLTTQLSLHSASSLARAPCHQSSTHRHCSLSPSSHAIIPPHNDTRDDEVIDPLSLPEQFINMLIHVKRHFKIPQHTKG